MRFGLFSGIRLRSFLTASYLLKLQQINDDGTVWRADGTLGPCDWTSCSGAPKWRATWQNTFDFSDRVQLDPDRQLHQRLLGDGDGRWRNVQGLHPERLRRSGRVFPGSGASRCSATASRPSVMDAHAEYKPLGFLTLYGDVLNVFNRKPNLDVNAAYGIYGFNPAWQDRLFMGRYFRIGARVDMDPRPAGRLRTLLRRLLRRRRQRRPARMAPWLRPALLARFRRRRRRRPAVSVVAKPHDAIKRGRAARKRRPFSLSACNFDERRELAVANAVRTVVCSILALG